MIVRIVVLRYEHLAEGWFVTVGLNPDSRVSPTPSRQLSLSLEILESELQKTVHSDPPAEEAGNGADV